MTTTTETEALIRDLAGRTPGMRPLARPWVRAASWLAIAVPSALVVVALISAGHDWESRLLLPRVVGEEGFALATGILAAIAAFVSVVPGYNRRVLLLPLVPPVLWLGGLGQSGVREWLQLAPEGFSIRAEWVCLPSIVMAGAVPAILMGLMLRRGAPLTPRLSMLLGGLASAGLGNLGVCVTHHAYGNVLVPVWHTGIVLALSAIVGGVGRLVLNWKSTVARAVPLTSP